MEEGKKDRRKNASWEYHRMRWIRDKRKRRKEKKYPGVIPPDLSVRVFYSPVWGRKGGSSYPALNVCCINYCIVHLVVLHSNTCSTNTEC